MRNIITTRSGHFFHTNRNHHSFYHIVVVLVFVMVREGSIREGSIDDDNDYNGVDELLIMLVMLLIKMTMIIMIIKV